MNFPSTIYQVRKSVFNATVAGLSADTVESKVIMLATRIIKGSMTDNTAGEMEPGERPYEFHLSQKGTKWTIKPGIELIDDLPKKKWIF